MRVIVATEKASGVRYGYCVNSGVSWFAPGLTSLCVAVMPILKAEARIEELRLQQLVRLFRKEKEGIGAECETVNLNGSDLTLEEPIFPSR